MFLPVDVVGIEVHDVVLLNQDNISPKMNRSIELGNQKKMKSKLWINSIMITLFILIIIDVTLMSNIDFKRIINVPISKTSTVDNVIITEMNTPSTNGLMFINDDL